MLKALLNTNNWKPDNTLVSKEAEVNPGTVTKFVRDHLKDFVVVQISMKDLNEMIE